MFGVRRTDVKATHKFYKISPTKMQDVDLRVMSGEEHTIGMGKVWVVLIADGGAEFRIAMNPNSARLVAQDLLLAAEIEPVT